MPAISWRTMPFVRATILCVVTLTLLYSCWPEQRLRHPPGVLAPREPEQGPAPAKPPWKRGLFDIRPLASFKVEARILSKAHYWFDAESELSPYDLALGWGQMSDQSIIDTMSISQSTRWYHYSWPSRHPPIDDAAIIHQSSNMHMIPASKAVAGQIASAHVGQVAVIEGYLIEATHDGWRWTSSLSRDDTGRGACEVVWVESISVRDR
ncbi:MAG: hypothetical protein NTW19_13795 [Planctomycetota bacterium]|nr:hypothetical protein [Planctomycetota bacterium]